MGIVFVSINTVTKLFKDTIQDILHKIPAPCIGNIYCIFVAIKVQQSRNRTGVAQRVPGGLGS